MHDWWISLVASAFGKRAYIPQPLLDYRQHETNTIGAKPVRERRLNDVLKAIKSTQPYEHYFDLVKQAKAFESHYHRELKFSQKCALQVIKMLSVPVPIIQKLLFQLYKLL